jgi:hypothetical protein
MNKEEGFVERNKEWMRKLELSLALSCGLILLAAVAYGLADVVFAAAPISKQNGIEDLVLGSRTIVAAIRIALIFASAFFVVSIVALAMRRQWLVRVGPVEVSEQVSDLRLEKQLIEESLESAMQTIDSLRYELAVSSSFFDRGVDNSGEAK